MEASVLKLLAEDSEELGIVAAAVQDALVKPQDIKFNKRARTFGLEVTRFQWESAGKRPPFFRSRAILAFAGVESVRSRGVSKDIDAVHDLLDIRFDPAPEPPGGTVTLTFAGKTQIQLAVECIDVTFMDTGTVWPTSRKPDHGKTA
jgi:hypothetical protein